MKWKSGMIAVLFSALIGLTTLPAAEKDLKAGDVAFTLDLTKTEIRSQLLSQGAEIVNEGPKGEPCLRITSAVGQTGNPRKLVSIPVDMSSLQGARVCLTGLVRGENIQGSDPAVPLAKWRGAKCQLNFDSPSRGKRWYDEPNLHGTFPWRPVGAIGGIVEDVSKGQISLGVEGATGTVWISDVRITVLQPRALRNIPADAEKNLTQKATQMRGVMSPNYFAQQDFADLAGWKVNLMRWQVGGGEKNLAIYDEWFEGKLGDLSQALDAAQANGIKLAVDLHLPPGGRYPDATLKMVMEEKYQQEFIANWERIARRFKDHPALWAYDLINEPVQNRPSPTGLGDWLAIQVKAAKAIRAIDSKTPIIIEVDQWDSPDSFSWLEPVDVPNVIYQAHMYWPGAYTHQGVKTDQGVAKDKDFTKNSLTYPGMIEGKPIDKEALRRYLEPVRRFQLAHNARIYIGEFSAARWAPGAATYLDDCISIFEEYGWDWTYHAFREWPGWSVEHADLPYDRSNHPKATQPTERFLVLQKWFAKNEIAGKTAMVETAPKSETKAGIK